jgi:hypothetical protein
MPHRLLIHTYQREAHQETLVATVPNSVGGIRSDPIPSDRTLLHAIQDGHWVEDPGGLIIINGSLAVRDWLMPMLQVEETLESVSTSGQC